jgi:D-glycero-alpha-D-manno-heptose-7-phosphate kinase
MIIIRSPFRIPIAGGGTDLDFYYKKRGGDLISATIDQYIYILISIRPLDKKILIQNTETQFANNIKYVKNKLIKEILSNFGFKKSIQVANISTLPTQTGLGSSSSLTVGLIKGLLKIKKKNISKNNLAKVAYKIERQKLKFDGGWQDQIIASYGGIQRIKIDKKGKFKCNSVKIKKNNLSKLEKHFILVYSEETRNSEKIITAQRKNNEKIIQTYDKIKSKVKIIEKYLIQGNFAKIGNIFHDHWIEKKKLTKNISNIKLDKMYNHMMLSKLFYGGKIIGAGGGGFFLMVLKNENKAIKFLNRNKLRFTRIKFDHLGAKMIN